MKITYTKSNAHFTFTSHLSPKPITFSIRKNRDMVEAARTLLEREFAIVEREISNMVIETKKAPAELTRRARRNFRCILKGYVPVTITEVHTLKVATKLNARGENDYQVVREERFTNRVFVEV